MCGLYGIMGRGIRGVDLAAYRELLWVGALRGTDSTGVLFGKLGKSTPRLVLNKYEYDSPQYLFDYKNLLNDTSFSLMMGHCRAATVGKVNKQNAHPFDVGGLVGAHNGTLVSTEFKSPEKTDSELMFNKMQSVGIKETLEGLTRWDAYAVSVYDKSSKKVILARNSMRPLYLAASKDSDVIFWGSEWRMLQLVLSRNQIDVELMALAEDTIHEISLEDISKTNPTPYHQTGLNVSDDVPWGQEYLKF